MTIGFNLLTIAGVMGIAGLIIRYGGPFRRYTSWGYVLMMLTILSTIMIAFGFDVLIMEAIK